MLILRRIDDPRDSLDKARLVELLKFAADNGVEIPKQFQDKAIIVRQILRQRGLTRIKVPNRILGKPHTNEAIIPDGPSRQVDLVEDLMRQVLAAPAEPSVTHSSDAKGISGTVNEMAVLRKECKRLGIKTARTDKMADLRAKLDGKQDSA